MCGLVGFIGAANGFQDRDWAPVVQRMADAIVHRGPDDSGVWADPAWGIALGHRRLSILDLSAAGHQPMLSADGRFVLAFNGEIYNHQDLRRDLAASGCGDWRGHSDTETLLAGFVRWGIQATIERAVGMFAIAVWDRGRHTLTLVRDRMGEKPLYYGIQRGVLLFGSELRALREHPAFSGQIDRGALALLLRHNYVPAPHSIFQGIRKLKPACLVEVPVGEGGRLLSDLPEPRPYWSARGAAAAGLEDPFAGSADEAVSELERLLKDAVGRQMVADVPLGAFLSGGVDSSTIVALMQAQSSRPVKTFSIGFHEEGYNEADHAKAVARHLGTEHTELYVTPAQAMEVIPRLPALYDEPFSDSSQIPTFLVAQMARRDVKVALSGDGGDELFCGYDRYFRTQRIWQRLARMPLAARAGLGRSVASIPIGAWNRVLAPAMALAPRRYRRWNMGDKLHKLAEVLSCETPQQFYLPFVSHWKNAGDVVLGSEVRATEFDEAPLGASAGLMECLMALDMVSYLPDDILVKVDRAAMGVSLETRVPLLDHQVVEFAWRLPMRYKARAGVSKWVLREVLYRHVPKELIERPKMGFGVPIDAWLRGPLREWAESLLDGARLRHEGFFDPEPIRQKWTEHLSGLRNWHYYLWDVLIFQAWLESWQGSAFGNGTNVALTPPMVDPSTSSVAIGEPRDVLRGGQL